jgi:2-methylisocitrate lyase-like PEP mutase family enzyme
MYSLCEAIKETPLVANMVTGGSMPLAPDKDLFAMGFQKVSHPICLLGATLDGLSSALTFLRTGSGADMANISALNEPVEFCRR